MEIIDKQKVPYYELICEECKSKLRYKECEVAWLHLTCPVCGHSNWANTVIPAGYYDAENDMSEINSDV